MGIEHGPRLHRVALALGHFGALFVLDMAKADDVLEADPFGDRLARLEHGGLGVERVEPAARLVDGLADEVRGEVLEEGVFVFEGVVPLGVGHRAAIEPGVGHLRHALRIRAALFAAQEDVIDERAVEVVQCLRFGAVHGLLDELRLRTDAHGVVARFALPERQRRAPVAFAAEGPIDVVLQPVAEAPVLQVLRIPVDLLVALDQRLLLLRRADVPARLGVVEQRRVAAPAERVGVLEVRLRSKDQISSLQVTHDVFVRIFRELPRAGQTLGHDSAQVYRLHEEEAVDLALLEVLVTEGRRGVDDARAVVERNVISGDYPARAIRGGHVRDVAQAALVVELHGWRAQQFRPVERLVAQADEVRTRDRGHV